MANFAGHVAGLSRDRSMRTFDYQPFSYDHNTFFHNLHTTLHNRHLNPFHFTNDLVARSPADDKHSCAGYRGASSGLRSN